MLVRNRKTQTYLALLLFFFALLMPLKSYAAQNSQQQISTQAVKTGWVQTGEKWKYVNTDGSYPKNTWKYLYSTWYYFNEDGWMVTGWKEINEKTYYLRPSGAMVVGWVKLEGKYYYFNSSGVLQKMVSGLRIRQKMRILSRTRRNGYSLANAGSSGRRMAAMRKVAGKTSAAAGITLMRTVGWQLAGWRLPATGTIWIRKWEICSVAGKRSMTAGII